MKAVIQHNFTSGLGDFICDMSEYLSVCEELKSQGYYIVLVLSLYRNKYVDSPFLNFVFDKSTLDCFDEVIETFYGTSELIYLDCNYYCSTQNPQSPGVHHWDIFFDVIPKDFEFVRLSASKFVNFNSSPKKIPLLSENIWNKVKIFEETYGKDYDFIHIRTSDLIDTNLSRYNSIIEKVKEMLSVEKKLYYLGTNNAYIYNSLKNYNNLLTLEFQNYEKFNNDMNAFTLFYNLNEPDGDSILMNRVYNILTEMTLIKNCNNLYYYYDIHWISNFVFYGLNISEKKINLNQIVLTN